MGTGLLTNLVRRRHAHATSTEDLYRERELEDFAHAAGALNGKAKRAHVAMNNNRGDYPAVNGMQLKQMLREDWHPPETARRYFTNSWIGGRGLREGQGDMAPIGRLFEICRNISDWK